MSSNRVQRVVLPITLLMVTAALGVVASSRVQAADVTSDLVAYYRLDGDAADGSGYGNDGIVAGPVATADRFGNPNGALEFDGIDDLVEIADSPEFNFNQPLTVALWVRSNSSQTGGLVGQWGPGGVGGDSFQLFNSDARLSAAFPSSGLVTLSDPTPYANENWRFVAVTCDGSTVRFFIDGSPAESSTLAVDSVDSTQPIILGMERIDWNLIHHFDGAMDDVMIFNRVLTDGEIEDLSNLLFTSGFELGNVTDWTAATP